MLSSAQTSIDSRTSMGTVALKVKDLDRSLRFYRDLLGFSVIDNVDGVARIGTSTGRVLFELEEERLAKPRPRGSTGLYHAAILLPTRGDLGRLLGRLMEAGVAVGQSDHLVSEALYIADPDGNGLELYRDRPREEWRWRNGRVEMGSKAIDLQSLYREGQTGEWTGLPDGSTIGHVHLNVGDIAEAKAFYHDVLGFDIVADWHGALFVSAGDYHHHLGLNVWESPGGGPPPETSLGLRRFTIEVADVDALDDIRARLVEAGVEVIEGVDGVEALDPWRNRIKIEVR